MATAAASRKSFSIRDLLKPHRNALLLGFLAAIGDGAANLLQPWPMKIVLDNVLKQKKGGGWLNTFIANATGGDALAMLKFAALSVLVIALIGALCSYAEKYFTTNVGQWVMHELRQRVYFHMQRLSLAYHDENRTGDLISRVTSDIDAIQSFITAGLLDALMNVLTLAG